MNIYLKLLTLFLFSFTLLAPKSEADTSNTVLHKRDGKVSIWRNAEDERSALPPSETLALMKTARELQSGSHWLLSPLQNHAFGILIRSDWTKGGGLWAKELKTPEGENAILLSTEVARDSAQMKRVLLHEMIHLAHEQKRPNEDSWVREGVALLGEKVIAGYYHHYWEDGNRKPESSLTESLNAMEPDYKKVTQKAPQYGHILQYFYYLYKNCGGDSWFKRVLNSDSKNSGVSFIDETLKQVTADPLSQAQSICKDFKTSFKNFQYARFMNDPSEETSYLRADTEGALIRDTRVQELPPYSASAYRITLGAKCATNDLAMDDTTCLFIRFE